MKYLKLAIALTHLSIGLHANSSAATLKKDNKNSAMYSSRRSVWSNFEKPSQSDQQSIGSYAGGCIAGAQELPLDGAHYHGMRPSRNRHFGHSDLVSTIQDIAYINSFLDQGRLLVGDMIQPRGGPMKNGHASHQSGLDADIWFLFWDKERSPTTEERENLSSVSLVHSSGRKLNDDYWTKGRASLLKSVASMDAVQRIFINPHIKKGMCKIYPEAKDHHWMKKLRPWYGHDYHFHVRLKCPSSSPNCAPQTDQLPSDNGCGDELSTWFNDDGTVVSSGSTDSTPSPNINLPIACRSVEESAK